MGEQDTSKGSTTAVGSMIGSSLITGGNVSPAVFTSCLFLSRLACYQQIRHYISYAKVGGEFDPENRRSSHGTRVSTAPLATSTSTSLNGR